MARILIIEDERDLAMVMAYNLRTDGFEVTTVETGADALREVAQRKFDLIVLDLMLPDASGLDICRKIRLDPETRAIPVVIASARGEEVDRVVGLELGADDYLVKPFSVRELVLRIRAILRRAESVPPPDVQTIQFGCLKIDRLAHRVFVEAREVVLTALEFRLLCTLYERRNRTQSRDTLLLDVWQMSTPVESRTVDTHVKRLREKLGNAGIYVRTVRGVGYRFAETPDEPVNE